MIRERLLEAHPRDAGFFIGTAAAGVGNHGENMGSNCEPDETDHIWSAESHREMEFTLHSLRSLVLTFSGQIKSSAMHCLTQE
jgi:hypothetical protein